MAQCRKQLLIPVKTIPIPLFKCDKYQKFLFYLLSIYKKLILAIRNSVVTTTIYQATE